MKPIVYDSSRWLFARCADVFFPGECHGLKHIPRSGPFILAANHASFLDPPIVGCRLERRLVYFARKTLWKRGFSSWWLDSVGTIPVDRDGGSDTGALKRILGALRSGQGVILFPEGTRTEDGSLKPAKPGVGMIACRTQAPVVPARIFGSFEAFGRHRRFPKLFTPVHVLFGRPMQPSDYDEPNSENRYQRAADRIMAAIGSLEAPRDVIS